MQVIKGISYVKSMKIGLIAYREALRKAGCNYLQSVAACQWLKLCAPNSTYFYNNSSPLKSSSKQVAMKQISHQFR